MASKMTGVREYRAALKRLPTDLREEVGQSIKKSVDGVHARGRANLASMTTRRSGVLLKNYRKTFSAKSLRGRVGFISPAARKNAFYARFINDGTVNMQARPFHTNAVEAEMEIDAHRMVKARDDALRTMATRGRVV